MALTPAEKQLQMALEANADAFDNYFDDADNADAPAVRKANGVSLSKMKGNPTFKAQFDISATPYYFTVTGGVYTPVTAAALNAALKTKLAVFFFGWNDFKAGYTKLQQQFPVATWLYGTPFIYGYGNPTLTLDANSEAVLVKGDLVIPFTSALPGAGTTTVALMVVHCTQVAYATLLESMVSDRFVMNMIRYIVPDETAPSLAQFANNIGIFKQSLFGRFNSDFVSPNSFKVPEQQQKNLIDIPISKGIQKEIGIGTNFNYDCGSIEWSTFVWTVKKLS